MPHVIEPATSGRATCRGCGQRIARDDLRLGERLPNPYAEGEMTHWYHPACAAFKRPQAFLEALDGAAVTLPDAQRLRATAQRGVDHRRLPRVDGAERASTGRARCRSCREAIPRHGWRIRLVFWEEGRFQPSGFIHAHCAADYFETAQVVDAVRHFSPDLKAGDVEEFRVALEPGGDTT